MKKDNKYIEDLEKRCNDLEERMTDTQDTIAELESNNFVLLNALRDIANHGTRHDTCPTMAGEVDVAWWYSYLNGMDQTVREEAKRALSTIGEDWRINPGPLKGFSNRRVRP